MDVKRRPGRPPAKSLLALVEEPARDQNKELEAEVIRELLHLVKNSSNETAKVQAAATILNHLTK